MKTLQNNFTTPEQSKRLLELGVPADSADMFWAASDEKYPSTELVWNLYIRKSDLLDKNFFKIYNMNEFQVIPCWSVGRLIEICKICVADKNELCEIFDELKMCVDETTILVQTFKEFRDVIDFSKLEE